ncbi:MAG: hypothetical protein ABII71_06340 [Candidatus Micrarchaeota archaeon]
MAFRRFDRNYILRKGFIDVKAIVTGLRQTHRLKLVRDKSPYGWITILEGRYSLPETEMVRLAEELQFPIRTKDILVFPKGKMQKDFAIPYTEAEKQRFAAEIEAMKKAAEAEEEAEDEEEEGDDNSEDDGEEEGDD